MKRRAPMRRAKPIARRPRRPKAGDDARYLAFVRSLPCCAPCPEAGGLFLHCPGHPIEAHHLTGAGLARKALDSETLPLCRYDHRALHEFTGPFRGWSREQRREWQLEQIRRVRALYRAQGDAA